MANSPPEAERAQSIHSEGATVEHVVPPQVSPPLPPLQGAPPTKPWWVSLRKKAWWLVVPLGVAFQQWCMRSFAPSEIALDEMKAVLEKHYLAAPSTAKWVERKVISHEGAYWQGHFVLDAQNQFGAMLRDKLCVVIETRGDGKVRWDRHFYVEEKCDADNAELLRLHRQMNGWGKAVSAEDQKPLANARSESGAGAQSCTEDGWCLITKDDASEISDIWGSSPDDIWAVGGSAARHWDGKTWTRMNFSDMKGSIVSVGGNATDDVWLAFHDGEAKTGSLVHWNGKQWSLAHKRENSWPGGIWANGPRDAWAVGSIMGGGGYIYHWNGESWTLSADKLDANDEGRVLGRLEDVWGTGPKDVWAVGSAIFHWNGDAWLRTLSGKRTKHLRGVWAGSRDNAWAVGDEGTALRWDGVEWLETDSNTRQLYGVWGSKSDVWAVGRKGAIIRWADNHWSPVSSGIGGTLMSVWGLNEAAHDGHVWAVGEGTILRHSAQ